MTNFSNIFQNSISVNTLIESLSEGVVFINKEGKILLVNKKTTELFGFAINELIGKPIGTLIPYHLQNVHKTHIQNYFESPKIRPMGHSKSKLPGKKKNGTKFSVEVSLSFLHTDIETFGMAFITDVSTRTKAENELKKRNLELDAYAHTIAHELHSQLNSIIGFSQVLLNNDELSDAKRKSFLEMIVSSGFKMSSIISEMLLFANLKKDDIVKTQLPMKQIVEEAINRISSTEKKLANIQIAPNFEDSIGHAPWIEEVWYNYIQNAIKYGGTSPSIEIGSSKSDDGYNKFWVKDNGIGLSERQCDLIFVDPQKLGNGFVKGHGLGLSIVKRIVKKLDGWVKVESIPNKGSVFSFYLPEYSSLNQKS